MEIQKIFSNVEDPEENLYSDHLDDTEIKLLSDLQVYTRTYGDRGLKDALLGSHVGYTSGLDGTKTVYTHGKGSSLNGSTLSRKLGDGSWKTNISNPELHKRILKDRTHPLHEKFAANVKAGRTLRKTGSYAAALKYLK